MEGRPKQTPEEFRAEMQRRGMNMSESKRERGNIIPRGF
jgi:hypothetical protein